MSFVVSYPRLSTKNTKCTKKSNCAGRICAASLWYCACVTKLSRSVMIRKNLWLALALAVCTMFSAAQETVHVQVDAGKNQGPFNPVWAYFGADEPNYSYAPHGKELVGELSA